MPTQFWSLSLTQLIVYLPSVLPLLYIIYRHRRTGILGWFFLLAFLSLQIVGSALVVSAGENGTPSTTAVILIEVGLSTLILAVSGVLVEWTVLIGAFQGKRKLLFIIELLFHIGVATGIALYAVGASNAAKAGMTSAPAVEKVGVIMLGLLWFGLSVAFVWLGLMFGARSCRPLFAAIAISLVLLGIRVLFRCVVAFDTSRAFSPVGGDIVYEVVLEFLPALGIVVALVTGGVMTIGRKPKNHRSGASNV